MKIIKDKFERALELLSLTIDDKKKYKAIKRINHGL